MTLEDLNKLVAEGESAMLEFKRCGNQPHQDTFQTICAFANRQGGNILLGVLDNGKIEGIAKGQSGSIKGNITNKLNNQSLFSAAPFVQIETINFRDKEVIKVWVPAGPEVYRYKGVVYDRIDDADIALRTDTQISALYLRKYSVYTERTVYPFLLFSDLRQDLIQRTRQMIEAKREDHPWLKLSDEEMLRNAGLYLRDVQTGEEGYTRAAALLLGTDEVIMSVCPAYKVDLVVQTNDTDRYDDRLTLKTNLLETYDQITEFAARYLPNKFYLEGNQAISLRRIIVRELAANMLMHREYTDSRASKFTIREGYAETTNPSRARIAGRITLDSVEPDPKNPTIANFFNQIGLAEDLGSGVRNLYKYAPLYGGAVPELTDGDMFVARVQTSSDSDSGVRDAAKLDNEILAVVASLQPIRAIDIVGIVGSSERTVKRHLAALVENNLLYAEGTTRDRRYMLPKGDM